MRGRGRPGLNLICKGSFAVALELHVTEQLDGIYCLKPRKALEISKVEGEQIGDAVNVHGSSQACIVHLYAFDFVFFQ